MAKSVTKHEIESYSPKSQASTLNILVFSEAEIASFLFAYFISLLLERVIALEEYQSICADCTQAAPFLKILASRLVFCEICRIPN